MTCFAPLLSTENIPPPSELFVFVVAGAGAGAGAHAVVGVEADVEVELEATGAEEVEAQADGAETTRLASFLLDLPAEGSGVPDLVVVVAGTRPPFLDRNLLRASVAVFFPPKGTARCGGLSTVRFGEITPRGTSGAK